MRAEVHRYRPVAAGEGLSLKLLTELMTLAYELGRSELFLFTKPCNAALFPAPASGQSPGRHQAVLMENSRERLTRYCRQLAMYRQPGEKIGAIVMNANPLPSATAGWWSRRLNAATGCICLW
jgi:[citrate (pro-3S)-lyase] ligase